MVRQRLRKGTEIYVSVVVAFGLLAVAVSTIQLAQQPLYWHVEWLKLAALTLISGWLSVKLPTVSASISISETFVFAGTLRYGPAVGAILVLLDAAVLCVRSQYSRRQFRWQQVIFNLAASPLSIWLAANAAGIRQPDPAAPIAIQLTWAIISTLAIFTALYFLLNSWLVTVAISLEARISPFAVWYSNFKEIFFNFLGGASIAAFLANARSIDVAFIGVILPLLLVIYLTYSWSTRRVEAERKKNLDLSRVFLSTIEALALAIDAKDQVTHGHIRRVQHFTMTLAGALGMKDAKQLDALRAAALLHDTGKLAVPEYILNKPGPLTSAEFERMKVHAAVGADILKSIEFPYPVEPIVRHHHENWDGSGYPAGLKGQEIPLGARILSVVDCYDALTSDRPYRPRMTRQQAERVLLDRRGSMYDPWVVDEFLRIVDRVEAEERARQDDDVTTTTSMARAQLDVISATTAEEREFNELRRALPKATSISSAADVLFRHLRRLIPAASFVLFVPADDSNELGVVFCSGVGVPTIKDVRIAVGQRASGWAFTHQESVLNADASLDLGPVARSFSPSLTHSVAVPLVSGSSAGVLTLYAPEPFAEDHRRLLENAASLFVSSVSVPELELPERRPAGFPSHRVH